MKRLSAILALLDAAPSFCSNYDGAYLNDHFDSSEKERMNEWKKKKEQGSAVPLGMNLSHLAN